MPKGLSNVSDPTGVEDSVEVEDAEVLSDRLLKEVEGLDGVVGVMEERELAVEAEDTVDAIEGA